MWFLYKLLQILSTLNWPALKFVASHVPEKQAIRPWLTQRRLLRYAARCLYMLLSSLVTGNEISDNEMAWAYHNFEGASKEPSAIAKETR
jgi:hypothetical protein